MRGAIVTVVACILAATHANAVEVASDVRTAVAGINTRAPAIEAEVSKTIGTPQSEADFASYADSRNKILRFLSEIRREAARIRTISDRLSPEKLQLEQDIKALAITAGIETTNDENQPLSMTAFEAKVDEKWKETQAELKTAQEELTKISPEPSFRDRVNVQNLSDEDRRKLFEDRQSIRLKMMEARSKLRSVGSTLGEIRRIREAIERLKVVESGVLSFGSELSSLESNDLKFNALLNQLDDRIFNFLLIEKNDNRYAFYSTLVFGIAVVIVIGSFFFVAYKSESVRVSIFANDSGLQFVTLFSLVIAIILFGVLKILGGKELAALLGGLSGYILGRGGITRQSTTPAPAVASPPAGG
ncbi:exported hypothetical protein [Hyphomicrobiales bacterium]|nr:exported hypothetical protein [Hyphomicrobiales bacterium]CAH1699930.1 exported hypothetical protein [Hyphomicrobiales bacterium]CAI0343689.1 exported hypothetical protein [Hyphomicrobiales bacterium]